MSSTVTVTSTGQPVAVDVVAHPGADASVRALEQALFARFCAQSLVVDARALRIPVRYRGHTGSPGPDLAAVGDAAARTLVVVLIDAEMVLDDDWRAALKALAVRVAAAGPDLALLPVALTPAALTLPGMGPVNMVLAHGSPSEARPALVEERVAHGLYRLLSGASARIFLSHAKDDGTKIATDIRHHLADETQLGDFFDTHDIPSGSEFAPEIDAGVVDAAAVLVILTDAYSGREWCRREVLGAKRAGVPVVLVDAMEHRVARMFPYLGGVPAVRWVPGGGALPDIVVTTLVEILRGAHVQSRVAHVARLRGHDLSDAVVVARPPELASLVLAGLTDGRLVYPDPPIGGCERALLSAGFPALDLLTPTELLRRRP